MEGEEHEINWNSQLERILSEEGERSLCYSWLHSKSEKYYSRLSTYITLPVIVMSTIAGAGSIGAQPLVDQGYRANIIFGTLSLAVATLNTVASYFGWAKRSESHRIAGSTYAKIHRFIQVELALPRDERIEPKDMLKIVREQCERLQETSPHIPETVINEFKARFGETTPNVKKPEITNGLDPIVVYSAALNSPRMNRHHSADTTDVPEIREHVKISISDHTPDRSQRSSSVHPLSESASDSNHILSSSCNPNTT
jgi:hypothetical protein